MFSPQALTQYVKCMLAAKNPVTRFWLFLFAGKAAGELAATVDEQLGDRDLTQGASKGAKGGRGRSTIRTQTDALVVVEVCSAETQLEPRTRAYGGQSIGPA